MSLYNMVKGAQDKLEGNLSALIEQFTPLLRKYAYGVYRENIYKLYLEDAFEMLLLDFIQNDRLRK